MGFTEQPGAVDVAPVTFRPWAWVPALLPINCVVSECHLFRHSVYVCVVRELVIKFSRHVPANVVPLSIVVAEKPRSTLNICCTGPPWASKMPTLYSPLERYTDNDFKNKITMRKVRCYWLLISYQDQLMKLVNHIVQCWEHEAQMIMRKGVFLERKVGWKRQVPRGLWGT